MLSETEQILSLKSSLSSGPVLRRLTVNACICMCTYLTIFLLTGLIPVYLKSSTLWYEKYFITSFPLNVFIFHLSAHKCIIGPMPMDTTLKTQPK